MCDIVDAAGDIKELVQFAKTLQVDSKYNDINNVELNKLRDKADYCPSCILAALRQSKLSAADFFSKKKLMKCGKNTTHNNHTYY